MRRELRAVALAGLLVLAGCSSAVAPGGSGDGASVDDATPVVSSGPSGTGSGTVNFYVSDERNAIGDFEHLNVTVERVSFARAGANDTAAGASEPADAEEGSDNGTVTPEPTDTGETEADGDAGDGDGEGDGEWITREVNATTVDLTELQGENATLLSRFDLPNGTYTQVRLHVSEVNGTLTSGEEVRVELPSDRLRLNERFTVGDGEEVDFVFDATVFEAGGSGKYVLKPVASESGTDVPIREIERHGDDERRLGAWFLGSVRPGEAATVKVTRDGEPVSGATVRVGDRTYRTGSDGTVMFDVPDGVGELEVEIEAGDAEAELKRTFGGSEEAGSQGSDPDDEGESRANDDRDDGGGNDGGASDGAAS
jgi:hypothetical protein